MKLTDIIEISEEEFKERLISKMADYLMDFNFKNYFKVYGFYNGYSKKKNESLKFYYNKKKDEVFYLKVIK